MGIRDCRFEYCVKFFKFFNFRSRNADTRFISGALLNQIYKTKRSSGDSKGRGKSLFRHRPFDCSLKRIHAFFTPHRAPSKEATRRTSDFVRRPGATVAGNQTNSWSRISRRAMTDGDEGMVKNGKLEILTRRALKKKKYVPYSVVSPNRILREE